MGMRAAVAAAVLLAAARPAGASDFKSIAKGVARAAQRSKVERIAVLPFVSSNGQHPEDGIVMSERLTSTLVEEGKVKVVERELLQSIMKEHYLSTSGVVSPEGRRQIGRILSVDAIVTGSFISFGKRAVLNARLIEVETGDILYAQAKEIPIDWFDKEPFGAQFAAFWGGESENGGANCRDAEAQLDRLERELLELKAQYWMGEVNKPNQ